MSETNELTAEMRDGVGKGASRAVRRQGKVPAVIYGDKQPPIPIALPAKEVTRRLHAGGFLTHIATIDVGGEKHRVIPKDYQLDPVRDQLMHVDFLRVAEGARLTLEVPVHFINEAASPGIKRGGALNVVRHAIELYVPADAIPEEIVVDLTGLDIGDSVHISAVTLPEGVSPTITDRDFTIATIAGAGGAAEAAEGGEGEAAS
jgi:large subunit ribosomal protein L25